MKKYITTNLVIHALILVLTSFLFRFLISWTLSNEYFIGVWTVASLYSISVYIMVWKLSVLDRKILPIYDLGFRFHFVTYIVWVLVSYIWFTFGSISTYEHIEQVHITTLYWLIALFFHFCIYLLTRKKSIKGLKKSEIFD